MNDTHHKTDSSSSLPDWQSRFLENRLSDQAETKPYERYIFELLADRNLSPTEKLTGVAIWLHADRFGKNAWPGQELIAWFLGRDVRSVRRATRKLEEHGFLSTETGKNQRSSHYTLLVGNRPLQEIPKRTFDELAAIFTRTPMSVHPDTDDRVTRTPTSGEPPCEPASEPPRYIVSSDDDYTDGVGASPSGEMATRRKKRSKGKQGKASFDFMPEEQPLETVFESGDAEVTFDIEDEEIAETIRKATAGKVGSNLLTGDGIFTVRIMIAAMVMQTGCEPIAALEFIQGRIWKRIGQTTDRLNCYSLIFKPICADLHMQGDAFADLMPDHEYLRAQIEINDWASRIHPKLYTEEGIVGLQRLIDRHGQDLVIDTVIALISEPGGTERDQHHITTWGYFAQAVEGNSRREKLRAADIAPGDVLGHGMKLEIPF